MIQTFIWDSHYFFFWVIFFFCSQSFFFFNNFFFNNFLLWFVYFNESLREILMNFLHLFRKIQCVSSMASLMLLFRQNLNNFPTQKIPTKNFPSPCLHFLFTLLFMNRLHFVKCALLWKFSLSFSFPFHWKVFYSIFHFIQMEATSYLHIILL